MRVRNSVGNLPPPRKNRSDDQSLLSPKFSPVGENPLAFASGLSLVFICVHP
jgi:hypothetical protein